MQDQLSHILHYDPGNGLDQNVVHIFLMKSYSTQKFKFKTPDYIFMGISIKKEQHSIVIIFIKGFKISAHSWYDLEHSGMLEVPISIRKSTM